MTKIAEMAHDGLARAINPAHTPSDGDTLFAMSTGASSVTPNLTTLARWLPRPSPKPFCAA